MTYRAVIYVFYSTLLKTSEWYTLKYCFKLDLNHMRCIIFRKLFNNVNIAIINNVCTYMIYRDFTYCSINSQTSTVFSCFRWAINFPCVSLSGVYNFSMIYSGFLASSAHFSDQTPGKRWRVFNFEFTFWPWPQCTVQTPANRVVLDISPRQPVWSNRVQ